MPDAGDYGHDNESQGSQAGQASDWAAAFAALPQETPSADGWQRMQTRLLAATPSGRRTRWPLWLAAAASLALAVAIPMRMRPDATTAPVAVTDPVAARASMAQADIDPVIPEPPPAAASSPTSVAVPPATAAPSTIARVHKPRRGTVVKPSQRPIRTAAQPADATLLAATDTANTTDASAPASLELLYAQSAQLEGLLALVRDERVSSGTAAALADSLDTEVASIDAALGQADVTPQHRDALWRDRIETLRQLVGIETTQRLYAARGQQYDAALVSID